MLLFFIISSSFPIELSLMTRNDLDHELNTVLFWRFVIPWQTPRDTDVISVEESDSNDPVLSLPNLRVMGGARRWSRRWEGSLPL